MKIKRMFKIIVSVVLLAALVVDFSGCKANNTNENAENLSGNIVANPVSRTESTKDCTLAFTDFAVKLFKECEETGKNTLVSPLSVLCALSMTVNGADGETRTQAENVLGMKTEELNAYVYSYLTSLLNTENAKLKLANSIWFPSEKCRLLQSRYL